MTDHLNFFEPYENREASHEDQLTRAFIVALRHVPLAHAAWLNLVDRGHRQNGGDGVPLLQDLPEPEFAIQRAVLPALVERVVSVIQTDEHYFLESDVAATDRGQRLDGIVCYPPHLGIVVENKPDVRNVWAGQLAVNLPPESTLDPRVASVRWRDAVEAFSNLLAAGHVRGSEALILYDFLDLVGDRFPGLQPFSRFGVCGSDEFRLTRRCKAVLEEISSGQVSYHRGWGWYIGLNQARAARMVALLVRSRAGDPQIMLEVDPGDTMNQARHLYRSLAWERLAALVDSGWEVVPNLHLSFMASNLQYPQGTLALDAYVAYWIAHASDIRQIPRSEFDSLFGQMSAAGLASADDRAEFDRHFLQTERTTLNVCPGLTLRRWWPLSEAAELDAAGRFVARVREAVNMVLSIWGDAIGGDG